MPRRDKRREVCASACDVGLGVTLDDLAAPVDVCYRIRRNRVCVHRARLSGVGFRRATAIRWRISGLPYDYLPKVGREPEDPRLVG